jgi:hypothetical protein
LPAEGIHQRSFSNPCFSGDEYHPPVAALQQLQLCSQKFQFTVAAHNWRDFRTILWLESRCGMWNSAVSLCHLSDKSVTALGQCLDKPGLSGVVAKHLAQVEHVRPQHLGLHVGLWPESIQQLIVGNQASRVFDQVTQNRERFWCQIDGRTIAE